MLHYCLAMHYKRDAALVSDRGDSDAKTTHKETNIQSTHTNTQLTAYNTEKNHHPFQNNEVADGLMYIKPSFQPKKCAKWKHKNGKYTLHMTKYMRN
jgi:hypothetical protein